MQKIFRQGKWISYIAWGGVLLYVFLCTLHFASGRPLWLDENFIADNLKSLNPAQIFGPLKHAQAFPRLYLFIIQKIGSFYEYSVFSLRFLPFLFMLGGFFIWLLIYRTEEGNNLGYLLFILSWCGSFFMSYYSAELKQYSADVLVAAVFTLIILKEKIHLRSDNIKVSLIITYLLAPFLVLFSYTGYFFILLPAYNLVLGLRNSRKNATYLSLYLLSMIIAVTFSYNFDIKYVLADTGPYNYWKDYFISTASFYGFMKSLTEGLRNIFVRWFVERKVVMHIMTIFFPFAFSALFFYGLRQIRKDKGLILSLKSLAPSLIIILFIAGILKLYPFTGARITLFISPFIFYAIIKSLFMFKNQFFPLRIFFTALYTATLLSTSSYLLFKYINIGK